MSRRLGFVTLVTLAVLAATPAFSQSETSRRQSPGTMATIDRAAMQNRAACQRQARALKLSFFKRRRFVRDCIKH